MSAAGRINAIRILASKALCVLGLASLVDNSITWYHFLGDIIDTYVEARGLLVAFLFDWWAWFTIPGWFVDSVVVYGAIVSAQEITAVREASKGDPDLKGFLDYVPLWYRIFYHPLFPLFCALTAAEELLRSAWDWRRYGIPMKEITFYDREMLQILVSLMQVLLALVVLLFINWQVANLQ